MATDVGTPAAAAYDAWRDRRWRLTGVVFALVWLVAAALVLVGGAKRSDLGTLVADLQDGSVARVDVVAPPDLELLPRTTVELRWQAGPVHRFAEVRVDRRARPRPWSTGDRITTSPDDFLLGLAPDLEVRPLEPGGGFTSEWRGWRLPPGVGVLALASWIGTLMLAGLGPEPWRATRWAWGWLLLAGGPLGSLAYLLLGGPLGVVRPRNPGRRLTGGWAFLLVAALLGGSGAR
jgi:hypothetical protein